MATDDEVPPGTENTAPTQDAEATDEVDAVAAAVRAATGVAKARFSDRFESLGLAFGSEKEREELLERVSGDPGPNDLAIMTQIAEGRLWVLRKPASFSKAHRTALRSLEVLERAGGRAARLPKLGPFKFFAQPFVSFLVQLIVQGYVRDIGNRLHTLYAYRLASSLPNSQERVLLRRAYLDLHAITEDRRMRGGGILTMLATGAVMSTIASLVLSFGRAATHSWALAILAAVILIGGMFAFSWCAIKAAAISRRRIKLVAASEIGRLYRVIGGCGEAPRDKAMAFALMSTVLIGIAWLLIPVAISLGIAQTLL